MTFPRPRAYPFSEFLLDSSAGKVKPANYVIKEDGFCFKITATEYITKNGFQVEVTETPSNILEAIVYFLHTKHPKLNPSNIKRSNGKPVIMLMIEFVAYRKKDPKGTPYLQGLYLKECLDRSTGFLNETDFDYFPKLIDAKILHGDGPDPVYYRRLQILREALTELYWDSPDGLTGDDFMPEEIIGANDLMDALLNTEGVVLTYEATDVLEDRQKVKLPRVVMKARIVAVGSSIEGFLGYTHILAAVPEGASNRWRVVHAFDWTEIFTNYHRVKEGRPYINQHSVKAENGRIVCTSSSTMQPMVDAVFRAVSGVKLFPPIWMKNGSAHVRKEGSDPETIVCGNGRSFSFKDVEYLFLAEPVDVILGASELWSISSGDVHLQPAWILAMQGFGNEKYLEIKDYTPLRTLKTIAEQRTATCEVYELVGMPSGPFLGLEDEIRKHMTSCKFSPYSGKEFKA